MSVGELLERFSARELTQWQQLFVLHREESEAARSHAAQREQDEG